MKLIVGLGNPGIEYQFTPHNSGFLAVDRIAEVCGVQLANRRGRALTAKTKLAGHEVLLAGGGVAIFRWSDVRRRRRRAKGGC